MYIANLLSSLCRRSNSPLDNKKIDCFYEYVPISSIFTNCPIFGIWPKALK